MRNPNWAQNASLKKSNALRKKKKKNTASHWWFVDIHDDEQLQKTAAKRFLDSKEQFKALTNKSMVETGSEIVSVEISNDETRAIVLV